MYWNNFIKKGSSADWDVADKNDNYSFFSEYGFMDRKVIAAANQIYLRLYAGWEKFSKDMINMSLNIVSLLFGKYECADSGVTGNEIYDQLCKTTFGDLTTYIDEFPDIDAYCAVIHDDGTPCDKDGVCELFTNMFTMVEENKLHGVSIIEYTTDMFLTLGMSKGEQQTEMLRIIGHFLAKQLGVKHKEKHV